MHVNARCSEYPTANSSKIQKVEVPDTCVAWAVPFPDYSPPVYNTKHKPCDDFDTAMFAAKFNCVDGDVNRVSNLGQYSLSPNGIPLNPFGRTGIAGRGRLPRFGPNHAADCIVSRWKRDEQGNIIANENTKKPVIQFLAICRRDSAEWAIPGGKVNPGEDLNDTFLREFQEEALDGFKPSEQCDVFESLESLFSKGTVLFCGYVDDPRNTDNAWMETTVKDFHDNTGDIVSEFPLKAGDDAGDIEWCDVGHDLKLFASHLEFVKLLAEKHSAHW